jgi:ABC-type Fe3+-hydroxamate transport system substrate-binding protein
MIALADQIGNRVLLQSPANRIVSLVPSQTELLHDLGLDAAVVGVTKFCIHPHSWFISKPRIGGTKNLQINKILDLKPDLVIANKEENEPQQVHQLMQRVPVYTSDVHNVADAVKMIQDVGVLTDTLTPATRLANKIDAAFDALPGQLPTIQVAYLIWYNPMMVAGGDTFISHMMQQAGMENCFVGRMRYPEITEHELKKSGAELVLLSSEPFPFGQKHLDAFSRLMPDSRIMLVDGEMFSWYGSRLIRAAHYLRSLRQQLS